MEITLYSSHREVRKLTSLQVSLLSLDKSCYINAKQVINNINKVLLLKQTLSFNTNCHNSSQATMLRPTVLWGGGTDSCQFLRSPFQGMLLRSFWIVLCPPLPVNPYQEHPVVNVPSISFEWFFPRITSQDMGRYENPQSHITRGHN